MATPTVLRSQIASLTRLANNDLAALWRQVSTAAQARQALEDVLPALIQTYGAAAGALAAEWYDEARAKAGVPKRFEAIPAEVVGTAGAEALAGYAIGPLFGAAPDFARSLTMAQGGLQRRIANVSRDTVMGSSIEDPSAVGWQRVGSGECSFCSLLIGRGSVYSERSADFASHDACGCAAVPAFGGKPRPVKPYTPSDRRISDADRKRVREYIRKS
jgi:hypothetical protein